MVKRITFIVLTLLWMSLIFGFSSRRADLSTVDSHRIGFLIGRVLHSDFEEWPQEAQQAFVERIDHPIRKLAHASEYAVLAVFLLFIFPRFRGRFALAWLIASVYAATDEFHQRFVPGRSAQLRDVLIDSAGAFCAMLLCFVIDSIIAEVKVTREIKEK